jgi:hydrogenase/urease accessory protein HupE
VTLFAACTLAGIAAVFHGHAHGVEMPAGASAMLYIAGLVTATGLLHALGIALALLARWSDGHDRHLVRPPSISILRVPVLLRLPRSR